jgi:hypothetical protein
MFGLMVSNHNMGRAVGGSRGSDQKLLKHEKYHPCEIQSLQELREDDFDRRIVFCKTLMHGINHQVNQPCALF